jgi:iron complex outermembrane recepter protein
MSVISGDDLLRFGAANLAEGLRWVPGLNVAQLNAAEWGISARGFNSHRPNKLLVLIDGRSVYTPLLAGVTWELQDPFLDDIDQVEVLLGPAGAVWGANAVNGVINVRSKHSRDTLGGRLGVTWGDEITRIFGRQGVRLSPDASVRVHATHSRYDASRVVGGGDGKDAWEAQSAGFRADWQPSNQDSLVLQGGIVQASLDREIPEVTPAGIRLVPLAGDNRGTHLLSRWTHRSGPGASLTLGAYAERQRTRTARLYEDRDTFNAEVGYERVLGNRHELAAGVEYRSSADETQPRLSDWVPASDSFRLLSAFTNYEAVFLGERARASGGLRFEDNNFAGTSVSPSLRMLVELRTDAAVWAAVSRATRIPNRADRAIRFNAFYAPPNPGAGLPLPLIVRAVGRPEIASESILAWEAGARWQPTEQLLVEASLFLNTYDDLIVGALDPRAPALEVSPAPPHLVTTSRLGNLAHARGTGGELSLRWNPSEALSLSVYGQTVTVRARSGQPGTNLQQIEAGAPEFQAGARLRFAYSPTLALAASVRHVDDVRSFPIDAFTALDLHLSWRPRDDLELSVSALDLPDRSHGEYGPQTIERAHEVERQVRVTARLDW